MEKQKEREKGTQKTERFEVLLHGEQSLRSSSHGAHKETAKQAPWVYLQYCGQIGFAIAVPIVLGALGGSYIDTRWGTKPKMTLIGLCGGIVVSWITFFQIIQEIIKKRKNSL